MFTGFSDAMIDFFWQLRLNNRRDWFQGHKETYVTEIYEPMKALAAEVCEGMNRKYHIDNGWKCSRIYRDARRPCPDGPYRDHLWFVLWKREQWSQTPAFFAEISAEGVTYGMGSYAGVPAMMQNYRARMEADSAAFLRIARKIKRDGIFELQGESYRRPKKIVADELMPWYNRKSVALTTFESWNEENMGAQLPAYLVQQLGKLVPLYRWLWTCVPPEES